MLSDGLRVGVVIDGVDRWRFFERFLGAPLIKSVDVIALRNSDINNKLNRNLSVFWLVLSCFEFLIKNRFKSIEISETLDYHTSGVLRSYIYFIAGWIICKSKLHAVTIDVCYLWNGTKAFSKGAEAALRSKGIKVLFLEIGNVPGKLFCDPLGTNKNSYLFNNIQILSDTLLDFDAVDNWLVNYITDLKSVSLPPQFELEKNIKQNSNLKQGSRNISRLGNHIFYDFSSENFHNKLPDEYYFVPLQVSKDSQLLLNSKVNNLDLIRELSLSKEYQNTNFVVKFHPCDSVESVEKILNEIKGLSNWVINQGPSASLIEKSKEVITINSTVGLEAILLDRPVKFYGESIFSKMDKRMALAYVSKYLLSVDYFSNNTFTEEEVKVLVVSKI